MKENEKIWAVKDGYLVNRDGSIYKLNWKRTGTMRKVKQSTNQLGYLFFGKNGKMCLAHRFIAECFIPNPNNLPEINHKDENKTNNCVDNLEWCTHKYNINYGTRNKKVSIAQKKRFENPEERKRWSELQRGKHKGKHGSFGTPYKKGHIPWNKGCLLTEEGRKKCQNAQKCKKVFQYTLNGEFVKEWVSLREIQRVLGYDSSFISNCCKGKYKTAYDSLWFFHRL